MNMPNVIATAQSFNTREAIQRIAATTVSNIVTFLDGGPRNLVTVARRKAS